LIFIGKAYLPALLFSNRISEGLNDYLPGIFRTFDVLFTDCQREDSG